MDYCSVPECELAEPATEVASWGQFMHITENLHDRFQTDLIEHILTFTENQQG
jgi:hypothetical protein